MYLVNDDLHYGKHASWIARARQIDVLDVAELHVESHPDVAGR